MSFAKCLGLWSVAVFVAVMLGGVSSAPSVMDLVDALKSSQISKEEVQKPQRLFEIFKNSEMFNYFMILDVCNCNGRKCECCTETEGSCVAVEILASSILVTATLLNDTIYSQEISSTELYLPPVCFNLPRLNETLCLDFYDVAIKEGKIHVCGLLPIPVLGYIDFDCFHFDLLWLANKLGSVKQLPNVKA